MSEQWRQKETKGRKQKQPQRVCGGRTVVVEVVVARDLVGDGGVQQRGRLEGPAARHVADGVTAAAQHEQGHAVRLHQLDALGVAPQRQVEAAQAVARQRVGTALQHCGVAGGGKGRGGSGGVRGGGQSHSQLQLQLGGKGREAAEDVRTDGGGLVHLHDLLDDGREDRAVRAGGWVVRWGDGGEEVSISIKLSKTLTASAPPTPTTPASQPTKQPGRPARTRRRCPPRAGR